MSWARHRSYTLTQEDIKTMGTSLAEETNWPVVYQIYNSTDVYVGETTNLKMRMMQHFQNPEKQSLRFGRINVIFDSTYNKSVALDLESFLIQHFSGDGKYNVINRNDGMCDRDYFERDKYREQFTQVWEELRKLKIADRSIPEIHNSELFKFSPYKNLNSEQLEIVREVLLNIDQAFAEGHRSLSIIDGDAGTGKTIVVMYLAKLLADLCSFDNLNDDLDDESNFTEFFEKETFNQRFKNLKIALVVPQTSLRERIESILKKVNLGKAEIKVFSPLKFASNPTRYDITLIDEAHLLKIGATGMNAGALRQRYIEAFGNAEGHSELDLILAKSKNVVMVYSDKQRVRQINIENQDVEKYRNQFIVREYYLKQQMRSRGGEKIHRLH